MMQGHFAALSSKYGIYCTLNSMNMASISLKSQIKRLLFNINYIIVSWNLFQIGGREIEKQLFNIYF